MHPPPLDGSHIQVIFLDEDQGWAEVGTSPFIRACPATKACWHTEEDTFPFDWTLRQGTPQTPGLLLLAGLH